MFYESSIKGLFMGFKVGFLILSLMVIGYVLDSSFDFKLSINSIEDVIEEVKDFDLIDTAVDVTGDITVGIYDFIVEDLGSSEVNEGLNIMFNATSRLTGHSSFESLVKGITSTVKANI